jgi:uncharacterized membrane protein
MDTVIAWGAKGAPYFIAIPMAIFGVQHFIYLQFVTDFIPAWIPWRTFWACFTGVALIAAAVGIVFKVCHRWAATLLGTMIFLWVLLLHTSRLAARPGDFGEWRGIFQALAMSGCAFVLVRSVARREQTLEKPRNVLARALTAVSELGARLAPYFVGVSMVALGLEHFVFAKVATPQVPVWIPGTTVRNYLSGTALIALGIGICSQRTRRRASTLLGIMIFLSMIFVHAPVVFRSPRFESDWTKTLVLSGGALLLARATYESAGSRKESNLPLWPGSKKGTLLPRVGALRDAISRAGGQWELPSGDQTQSKAQQRGDAR